MKSEPEQLSHYYLRPGELFIGSAPTLVTTVLGSCVSVTMFSPRLRLAAICHALLADPGARALGRHEHPEPFKYVSYAVPAMVDEFHRHGLAASEIQVKVFGGANVFGFDEERAIGPGVGRANILRAKLLLEEARLSVCNSHVGGESGRKLIFNTVTGDVMLKRLSSAAERAHPPKHHAS